MFALPQALAALRGHRQFIVYKLVPSNTRPGKTDKFPVDWRTGHVADAHDPNIWADVDTAAASAAAMDMAKTGNVIAYGVGFVFTADDDFWFIDVDDCVEADGTWSQTAQALMQRFAGAAWEVSASGRGLHGIGMGGKAVPGGPPHRRVKYHNYFDLYTQERFCALTGTNVVGDAATRHDDALVQLVADYLQHDAVLPSAWTTAPRADWRGNTDDDELISRALKSKSGAQAFGHRASFADLWHADVEKLATFYPPDHSSNKNEPYNASSADSALAQALAFWTGNDCERIFRLMHRSALVRPKWDEREGYLRTTILNCVARQYDVLIDKPAEATSITPAASNGPTAKAVTGDTFLTGAEQMAMFTGCVYVCSKHKALIPGGFMLKPDQFRVMFGGYTMPIDAANEKISRNAWEAFTESQLFRSPRADGITFRPECPPGALIEESGVTLANIWWPIQTPRAEGDAGPFLRHLEKLLPDAGDRTKLISYMAAILQYPGRKFQWAPLIQGVEGNGKTIIVTAMARAVGDRYSHLPNAQDFGGNGMKFTGWLEQKLFIGVEEIYTNDRREVAEALKPLITNSRIEIQAKGFDQVTGDNRANLICCSNHRDAVPKTANDRRWGIFFCAQQAYEDLARDGMNGNYMPDLWDWCEGRGRYAGQPPGFAIVNNYLRGFAIPDECNPTGAAHRAPDTTSTAEAIRLSTGAVEQEIEEAISRDDPGFAGGFVSSMALDKLLARLNMEKKVPPRRRRDLLISLGYDWHPALTDGRSPVSVQPDGGKTRIFVKRGHPLASISEPAMVIRKYTETQSAAQAAKANFGGLTV